MAFTTDRIGNFHVVLRPNLVNGYVDPRAAQAAEAALDSWGPSDMATEGVPPVMVTEVAHAAEAASHH